MADSVFSAPSLQLNDFLAAFGLDRADIKAIDISQDSGSLSFFLNSISKNTDVLSAIRPQLK